MNLAKAMRKNSNTLLMIFMSLLLVVFLLPGQMFSGGSGRAGDMQIGSAFGEPLYSSDVQRSQQVATLVRATGLGRIPQFLEPLDICLLIHEAERAGVTCDPEYVKEALSANQIPAQAIAQLQERYRVSRDGLYRNIGRWLAVEYLRTQMIQAVGVSRPRLEHAFRERNQEAHVLVSAVSAPALVHNIPEPNEAQLQAFFEAARDRETAHDANGLVFGYRQPPKVRLEVLTVAPRAMRDEMRVRRSEARAFYEANQNRYVERVAADDLAGPQQQQEPQMRQLTFEEAEQRVKDDLRLRKAREEAQRLVNDIHAEALRPWLGSTRDEDGFRIAPSANDQISFETLRDEFGRNYPVEYLQTDWISQDELAMRPVGQAQYRVSEQETLPAAQLAFRVRGLYEPAEDDRGVVLNLNEPSPVLIVRAYDPQTRRRTGAPEQAYMLRVLEVKPAGPPDSIDEVRPQIVEDWKLTQAFELAREQVMILADRAREIGLPQASIQAEALRTMLTVGADPAAERQDAQTMDPRTRRAMQMLGPQKAKNFTRARPATEAGPAPEIAAQLFDVADPLNAPLAERIFVQAVPQRQSFIVAQLEEIDPLYADEFEQEREQLAFDALRRDGYMANMLWLAPQNIRTRTQWRPLGPETEQ